MRWQGFRRDVPCRRVEQDAFPCYDVAKKLEASRGTSDQCSEPRKGTSVLACPPCGNRRAFFREHKLSLVAGIGRDDVGDLHEICEMVPGTPRFSSRHCPCCAQQGKCETILNWGGKKYDDL